MNLEKLSFGQLYKLAQPETLMRVTAAYHRALRRAWNADPAFVPEDFSVSLAEKPGNFSYFAVPWRRTIAFLRSSDLRRRLRIAADCQSVPLVPGSWLSLWDISPRRFYHPRVRAALAAMVMYLCEKNRVPCVFSEDHDIIKLRAETSALGIKLLLYKSGISWDRVIYFCEAYEVKPQNVFWWIETAQMSPPMLINPLVWPVNTPDVYEVGRTLVYAPEN